jgi:hypothetical protein
MGQSENGVDEYENIGMYAHPSIITNTLYRAYNNCCSSTATTLEAFRHNPTNVASYQCPLGQVLCHWFVLVVPLVLHKNAIPTV